MSSNMCAAILLCTLTFWAITADCQTLDVKLAPLLGSIENAIGNRFAVVFKSPIANSVVNQIIQKLGIMNPVTEAVCSSTIFLNADASLLMRLRSHPKVKFVEYVQKVKASADTCNVVTNQATWGVVRISQDKPSNSTTYVAQPGSGNGVRIYVIDTGTNINHTVFAGRGKWRGNFVPGAPDADDQGHGTCTGGLCAIVSPNATIYAIKVLNADGSGSSEWVTKGICLAAEDTKSTTDPVVINMSLGGPFSATTNEAVTYAKQAGAGIVVAAGNEKNFACLVSPASSSDAFTVGATTRKDEQASFSNWGSCVNIMAPGAALDCPSNKDTNGYLKGVSGTSLSSPIVAGLMANVITVYNISKGADAYEKVKELGLKNVVQGLRPLTPNLLANNQCHG